MMGSSSAIEFVRNLMPPTPDLLGKNLTLKYHKNDYDNS